MSRSAVCRVEAHGTGHTLVEVMLVTSIVAILLTMAVPAWREQGARAHRSIAISKLLQAAGCQAKRHAQTGHYDTSACRPTDDARYAFEYRSPGNAEAQGFTLVAMPVGAQEVDDCGWLSLDQAGRQQVENGQESRARCWSGR